MSDRTGGSSLWLIWAVDGSRETYFAGTLWEAVAEANKLHIKTGVLHAVQEIE